MVGAWLARFRFPASLNRDTFGGAKPYSLLVALTNALSSSSSSSSGTAAGDSAPPRRRALTVPHLHGLLAVVDQHDLGKVAPGRARRMTRDPGQRIDEGGCELQHLESPLSGHAGTKQPGSTGSHNYDVKFFITTHRLHHRFSNPTQEPVSFQ